jgi:hypothetical protein
MREHPNAKEFSFWMTEEEYVKFLADYKKTLCRTKSEYVRKMVLGQPVSIIYRNRSLDDFIEIAVKIRKYLREVLSKDIFSDQEKEEIKAIITKIELGLIKISEQCSQK